MKYLHFVFFLFTFLFQSLHGLHQLEQEHYFNHFSEKFQNLSRTIYQQHSISYDAVVGLSKCVVTYGGYGNFIGSLVTAFIVSLYSNRIFVLNNQVVLSMFQHPDPTLSFKNIELTSSMHCTRDCQDVIMSMKSNVKVIGVNRCDQAAIRDPAILSWYSKTFNVPNTYVGAHETWLLTENRPSYDIVHWLLSKPTPEWEKVMKDRAQKVYANCSRNGIIPHHANLGLQIRTFADLGRHSTSHQEKCYVDCAESLARYLHDIHQHPICVLVTSDNSDLTDRIITELDKIPYITAVHNDYPHASTLSHSAGILLDHRDDKSFSITKIMDHPEFIDWMLLSESDTAVYTQGSTFASSARYRAGLFRAKDDRVVREISQQECTCENIADPSSISRMTSQPKRLRRHR